MLPAGVGGGYRSAALIHISLRAGWNAAAATGSTTQTGSPPGTGPTVRNGTRPSATTAPQTLSPPKSEVRIPAELTGRRNVPAQPSPLFRGSQVSTQNSLNGVVRCQVVRAPAGNEAIFPAVSSSTGPSSISILAAPSKINSVSLPGRVHLTG